MASHLPVVIGLAFVLALGTASTAGAAPAAPSGQTWVTSWYAAPQPAWDSTFVLPMNVPASIQDQSVRETVRLSAGGGRIRIAFTNRYGLAPVTLGEACVDILAARQQCKSLTFAGAPGASIAPGATVLSDALPLAVRPRTQLAITSYWPRRTPVSTFHWGSQQTALATPGRPGATGGTRIEGRLFLSAVMVETVEGGRTVVVLGDSISDGNGSTQDADRRWPDFLALRLASFGIGVANAAISGGRLLSDGMGQSALARLDHDALSQPGVSDIIVLLGTNDIGWPGGPFAPHEPPVTLDRLIAGYRQLVAAARVRNIRVTAGTLPPFEGALEGTPFEGHYSPAKEALRIAFNHWIRTAGEVDAVIDFDAVLRNPGDPKRMRREMDSGDHLHPGDQGYRAMAQAVDIAPLVRQIALGSNLGRSVWPSLIAARLPDKPRSGSFTSNFWK